MSYRRESPYTQQEMFMALTAFARVRHEKYDHCLVDRWPSLKEMHENVYVGSFSWLGTSSRTRWLNASTAINVGGFLSTPGDVARDYLALKYQKRKRITSEQKAEIYRRRSHPLYASPIHLADGSYVDIKAAYWSILSIVGWDCDYFPARWLSSGEGMDDFPYAGHKLARNCLVTAGLMGKAKVWSWKHQKLFFKSLGNRFVNMQLWSLIMDILNGIAWEARDNVFYIHTDGYICDTEDAPQLQEIIHSWGLPCGIKHRGETDVYGAGQYHVGEKRTKRYPMSPSGLVGIYQPYRSKTLRLWVSKLAQLADPSLN